MTESSCPLPPPEKLCDKCIAFCDSLGRSAQKARNRDREMLHQPSCLTLLMSALKGCTLCLLIFGSFSQVITKDTDAPDGVRRSILPETPSELRRLVSEKEPGGNVLLTWAGGWGSSGGWVDRILVTSTTYKEELGSDDKPAKTSYEKQGEDSVNAEDSEEGEGGEGSEEKEREEHKNFFSGCLEIFAKPDDVAATFGRVVTRPVPATAGDSDQDFAQAELWIQDCLSNHNICRRRDTSRSQLPTRVLDVGLSSDGSQEPYLLETGGTMIGRYATLSHCWGDRVHLSTTTSTLEAHKDAVPLASMPLTFRHAVQVARRLGIQYIWIDSLCIIQDSVDDWGREASLMAQVYGNSHVTIAAHGASGDDGGFLVPRGKHLRSFSVPCHDPGWPGPGTVTIYCPFSNTDSQDPVRAPFDPVCNYHMGNSSLETRGWTLQEDVLSPRVLAYGSRQMFWECDQVIARQDGRDPFPQYNSLRMNFDTLEPLHTKSPFSNRGSMVGSGVSAVTSAMWWWHCTVETFSRRRLTVLSDKLPAIAGIAKELQRATGLTYVAGIWQQYMPRALLWIRSSAESSVISPQLPSWSWARLDCDIDYTSFSRAFFEWKDGVNDVEFLRSDDSTSSDGWTLPAGQEAEHDSCCEVLAVHYRPTTPLGQFGEVCDARIDLRGFVLPIRCECLDFAERLTSPRMVNLVFSTEGYMIGRIRFDEFFPSSDSEVHWLYCLMLCSEEGRAGGLALERVNASQGAPNVYRRVGYVTLVAVPLRDVTSIIRNLAELSKEAWPAEERERWGTEYLEKWEELRKRKDARLLFRASGLQDLTII